MNEVKLRAEVDKRRNVSDEEWEYLRLKGYIDEAMVGGDEIAVRDLVDEIDMLPGRSGAKRRPANEVADEGVSSLSEYISEPFSVTLSDAEAERAKVLLEIQLREANEHPHVKAFRGHYLSERSLFPGEAEEFLSSPDSKELEQLGWRLARDYGWHREDAAWWVLTDEAPPPRPLRVGYRWTKSSHGPDVHFIDLETTPWVSAETVKRAFLEMQWRVVQGTHKPLDSRTLSVLRFVEEQKGSLQAELPTYQVMLERWNRKHPGASSYPDYRAFRKAYKRAFKNVLYPAYNTSPRRKPTPNMERQVRRQEREAEQARMRAERIGLPKILINKAGTKKRA